MSQPTVLVVEDDISLREALSDTLAMAGYRVEAVEDGPSALECVERETIGVVVTDVQMQPMDGHTLLREIKSRRPDLPVVLMTAYGTIQRAVKAMHEGASDYMVKPFEAEVLVDMVNRYVGSEPADEPDLVTADPKSKALADLARRVARSEATVMITGDSGAGKEVFARYIHDHSERAAGPFVAINCAAIPENMLEAVLFGYEKGAFTGAYQSRAGKFEQAQAGTLLLDEISEMNLGLQAKLLRVLQEREVERLGGRKLISLDVRVLATSNRNLREEVAAGRFREDLFYRLNVFPLHLPALRERPDDILPLARRLVALHSKGSAVPRLAEEAEGRLRTHTWPGNVRELDNVIQRALILKAGDCIEEADIRFEEVSAGGAAIPDPMQAGDEEQSRLGVDLKSRERELIMEALRAGNGSRKEAAARLGISPRTLRYKLARLREAGMPVPDRAGLETA
jgi:two-component system response regulator FlrC